MSQGIKIEGLTKYYGDMCVFNDISFEIGPKEIVSVVGPSGCGKTTLLRCLNGLIKADSGNITLNGELVDKPRPGIAIVFQDFGLFPWKSVLDNVAYGLTVRGMAKKEAREISKKFIKLVALEGFENRYPHQLSGGMQQRAGLARALAVDPSVLLMDEPFGAVDPVVRADLQQELLALQRTLAKTVLFVTHDIEEAFLLGDQVVLLEGGQGIVQQGTPAEIISHPASPFVETFIGAHKGKRSLRLVQDDGVTIVVDANNRVAGRLEKDL